MTLPRFDDAVRRDELRDRLNQGGLSIPANPKFPSFRVRVLRDAVIRERVFEALGWALDQTRGAVRAPMA